VWTRVHWDPTNEGKIAANGVAKEEVEEVLFGPRTVWDQSRSSGRLIGTGWTTTGRLIAVPIDEIDADTVRPVTAFEVGDD